MSDVLNTSTKWKEGDRCFVISSKAKKYVSEYRVGRLDGEYYWAYSLNGKRSYRISPSRMFRTKEEALQSLEEKADTEEKRVDIVNQRFKEWRTYIGLSEEQFAKETGIVIERIRAIEAGKVKVKLSEAVAVSDTFAVSTDYLIGHREKPCPIITSTEEAIVWSRIEKLSPDQFTELKKQLKEKGLLEE